MKSYVNIRNVMDRLGLCGNETNLSEDQVLLTRSYGSRYAYEITAALRSCAVEAVEVTRCGKCEFCIQPKNNKGPKCICPSMPTHYVAEDGFCNYGRPKGGCWNG